MITALLNQAEMSLWAAKELAADAHDPLEEKLLDLYESVLAQRLYLEFNNCSKNTVDRNSNTVYR